MSILSDCHKSLEQRCLMFYVLFGRSVLIMWSHMFVCPAAYKIYKIIQTISITFTYCGVVYTKKSQANLISVCRGSLHYTKPEWNTKFL
jgi:hypothetical protein